jgi:hypothetical protein
MFEAVGEASAVPAPSLVDVLEHPDQVATELAAQLPGPIDAVALSLLDPDALSDAGRVDVLVALERQIAWLQAAQQRVLAALDGAVPDRAGDGLDGAVPDRVGDGRVGDGRVGDGRVGDARVGDARVDFTQEQVGAALRLSPGTAADRLAVARVLVGRLPATLQRLRRGQITYLHARKLAEAVLGVDDQTAADIEVRVLARAGEQTVGQFSASVRRAVIAADPRRAEQRHEDALAERRVVITAQDDGVAEVWALLPAEGAALVATVLDSLAAVKSAGEARSVDQRRADALVDVFARVLSDPALPEQHGARPAIQVTVAASTLLGCDQQPAELAGYGPITADTARRIAADESGTWRRLLTDPATGALLDYGRSTYRPPKDLAQFVITRDRTCVFPGCRRPAHRSDLDHGTPYDAGGATDRHNLHPLCRRHHRAKHEAGWHIQRHPDGTYTWTAPTGHHYRTRPPIDR